MWEPGAEVLDGRFKILQAVGVTSATENYLAEQVSLARKVSLRVIRPELGLQPSAGERFDREVRRIAAVDHPGVVRVIDSGRWEKTLYLVTEQVDGALLSSELKQGEPLLPERALELLTQLAEALAAVHEKGLVHGELNPAMVVLTGQRARLLDFGVARLLDAESPDERLTVATRAITAPEYLSPEQLKGKDAEAASDVYSLGVLALRVLAGSSQVQPLGGHLSEQHALIELVGRCTASDAAKRPASREAWQKFLKLPRPQEPTLFLEAMQRPPELPAKPAQGPPKLLESVPMLTLTPAQPSGALPPPLPVPAQPSRGPILAAGLVVGLTVAAIAGFGLMSSPASDARELIEKRQPSQALELLGKALRKKPTPELNGLRAAALHLSGQHAEEIATFKSLPADAKEALDPLVLGGVVEDFGAKEDTGLRAALKALPMGELKKVLEGFANEPVSMKQWGALRWLDLESQAAGLKLVELYSISLESNACPVRKLAAKRLQELDDDSAVEALNRAKEATEKDCGQTEAAAAVQSLKKVR